MAWETYISSLRFASDTALLGAMFRGEIVTPAAAAAAPVGVDDYAAPMRGGMGKCRKCARQIRPKKGKGVEVLEVREVTNDTLRFSSFCESKKANDQYPSSL